MYRFLDVLADVVDRRLRACIFGRGELPKSAARWGQPVGVGETLACYAQRHSRFSCGSLSLRRRGCYRVRRFEQVWRNVSSCIVLKLLPSPSPCLFNLCPERQCRLCCEFVLSDAVAFTLAFPKRSSVDAVVSSTSESVQSFGDISGGVKGGRVA